MQISKRCNGSRAFNSNKVGIFTTFDSVFNSILFNTHIVGGGLPADRNIAAFDFCRVGRIKDRFGNIFDFKLPGITPLPGIASGIFCHNHILIVADCKIAQSKLATADFFGLPVFRTGKSVLNNVFSNSYIISGNIPAQICGVVLYCGINIADSIRSSIVSQFETACLAACIFCGVFGIYAVVISYRFVKIVYSYRVVAKSQSIFNFTEIAVTAVINSVFSNAYIVFGIPVEGYGIFGFINISFDITKHRSSHIFYFKIRIRNF